MPGRRNTLKASTTSSSILTTIPPVETMQPATTAPSADGSTSADSLTDGSMSSFIDVDGADSGTFSPTDRPRSLGQVHAWDALSDNAEPAPVAQQSTSRPGGACCCSDKLDRLQSTVETLTELLMAQQASAASFPAAGSSTSAGASDRREDSLSKLAEDVNAVRSRTEVMDATFVVRTGVMMDKLSEMDRGMQTAIDESRKRLTALEDTMARIDARLYVLVDNLNIGGPKSGDSERGTKMPSSTSQSPAMPQASTTVAPRPTTAVQDVRIVPEQWDDIESVQLATFGMTESIVALEQKLNFLCTWTEDVNLHTPLAVLAADVDEIRKVLVGQPNDFPIAPSALPPPPPPPTHSSQKKAAPAEAPAKSKTVGFKPSAWLAPPLFPSATSSRSLLSGSRSVAWSDMNSSDEESPISPSADIASPISTPSGLKQRSSVAVKRE